MAILRWLGRALAVAQIDTITVANVWATGDTVTLTINGRSLVLTVGTDATTNQVATAIKEMVNGDAQTGTGDHTFSQTGNNVTEFTEVAATVASSVVTLTANTAGLPFTLAVSEVTADSGTATEATATAATGPNHIDNAENYDTGSVPVNADTLHADEGSVSMLYGDLSSVTLAALLIHKRYTGNIGLPKTNAAGYPEYRADYLAIGATACRIGLGDGQGSGRIKIDFGSVQTTCEVRATGSSIETDVPAVLLKGTHVSNALEVLAGSVGVAFFGGETATLDSLQVAGGATVHCGEGVTLNDIDSRAARLEITSAIGGELIVSEGRTRIRGTGTVAALTVKGGDVAYESSGTATDVEVGPGIITCEGDLSPRTFTNVTFNPRGRIRDPHGTLTMTNIARAADVVEISAA